MVHDHADKPVHADEQAEDPHAKHLRPRPPNPFVRTLNTRRVYRRWKTQRAIRYEPYGPPITEGAATDIRSITLYHRNLGEWPAGKVNYLICHPCRRAFVGNIDVNPGLQGQCLATGVLAHIRKQIPGYTWLTSRHMPGAKSFWRLIAERTGEDYADTEPAHTCEHMALFWYRGPTRAVTRSNAAARGRAPRG